MDLVAAYQIAASAVFSMMGALWLCSLALRDVSIVDRFWGAGFVLIAWALALVSPDFSSHETPKLTAALVSVWGIRLSLYITSRNWGHGEDYRYLEMRQHHGARFWWYSFFSVFMLQGVLMLIVSAPVVFLLSQPECGDLTTFGVVGATIWLVGFVFEAGGDWQLLRFKRDTKNKGKLLKNGLWAITRHPNYFGDALQWWGLGVIALPYGTEGSLTFIGPIVMTLFIRKVSGVDLLEKNLSASKPGYAEYAASTPAFLPRPKFWLFLGAGCLMAIACFETLSKN